MEPLWFNRNIVEGMTGPDVDVVRRKLGLGPGSYDKTTITRVKGFMSQLGYESDGEIDRVAAVQFGESAAAKAGSAPEWYRRPVGLWDEGEDVRLLRQILGLGSKDNRFDPDCEAAVRRFQSANGLKVDGQVTSDLARLLGEA